MSTGTPGAFGTVSVGVTAVVIRAARFGRTGLVIQNVHATNILYVGTTSSVATTTGIRVPAAGGTVSIDNYQGVVYGIADGASTDVRYLEAI